MFIKRTNQNIIFDSFKRPLITSILGSRRVGKTFLVKEYIKQQPNLLWVNLNMDDRSQREMIQQGNLRRMIEESSERQLSNQQKIWVSIDEAQKCPELFDQVKILYDEFKHQNAIKFILTGSGYLHLHQLSAETLAGRIELFYLREFGTQETLNLIHHKQVHAESTLSLACNPFNNEML